MKINKIKINAFGRLEDREIELSDNINVIYGKNETGKSTLLKFITNTFYGTSKNKKGKNVSDYDMYKPWNKEEFSGKINYELDNGETYEVYREFGKKNVKIYNKNLEEISKQFSVDKSSGSQFFYEQTKIDEDTFLSTFVSEQQEVKLDTQSQNILIQKIANIAGTGDDNISYKKAMDKLSKKQTEEIGTSRTQGKPINVVTQSLNKLKTEKEELSAYKNMKYEFEDEKNKLSKDIKKLELEKEYLGDLQAVLENKKVQVEKLEYNQSTLAKNDKTIDDITVKLKELEKSIKIKEKVLKCETFGKKSSKTPKVYLILAVLCILIAVIAVFAKIITIAVVAGVLTMALCVVHFIKCKKIKSDNIRIQQDQRNVVERNSDELSELNNKMAAKIAERRILEQNNDDLEKNIEIIKNEIFVEIEKQKEKIKNDILDKMALYELDRNEVDMRQQIRSAEQLSLKELKLKMEMVFQEINDRRLELHRMDLNNANIMPKLDNLAKVEEDLETAEDDYKELMKRNENIELAKRLLEQAYEKMKSNVTPRFTQNLSANLERFSNNKYKRVTVNDESGLLVELPTGEYVSAERLSVGTIDQLYLALRLSMVNELSDESLPIILDEAFAYFDDERLKNVLKFIAENYADRQVIILTCTTREEKSLEALGVKFNKVIM